VNEEVEELRERLDELEELVQAQSAILLIHGLGGPPPTMGQRVDELESRVHELRALGR